MQNATKTIGALVLALAGGAHSHAESVQAGPRERIVQAQAGDEVRDGSACTVERRERIDWRHHGHPAKAMPTATRVRETRQVCAGVARSEWRRDRASQGANG
jgi:hypothetical protein